MSLANSVLNYTELVQILSQKKLSNEYSSFLSNLFEKFKLIDGPISTTDVDKQHILMLKQIFSQYKPKKKYFKKSFLPARSPSTVNYTNFQNLVLCEKLQQYNSLEFKHAHPIVQKNLNDFKTFFSSYDQQYELNTRGGDIFLSEEFQIIQL